MKFIKILPNILSVLRILLAGFMCWLAWRGHNWWFVGVFFMVGATDFWDGKIARKFNVETKLGSQLDLIGDAAMLIGALLSLLLAVLADNLVLSHGVWHYAITIFATLVWMGIPIFITRARFGLWNKMHLFSYRLIGAPLFFLVPLFVVWGQINFWVILSACILIAVATVEEMVTLFVMQEYNINHNGVVGSKIIRKEFRGQ